MKEPKRYYCGNGEGMFEDDKNGHWVEYSEHKAIVEALSEQLRLADVSNQRELLIAFKEHLDNREEKGYFITEYVIDEFIESNL